MFGSAFIHARLNSQDYWDLFSKLKSVGITRNTEIRLGGIELGLAVLIQHAAAAGITDMPATINNRYDKCHTPKIQIHYTHIPPLQHVRMRANTILRVWSSEMVMRFESPFPGCSVKSPVWSVKEACWSLRRWIIKSVEHLNAEDWLISR